jgi:pectate lyase
MAVNTGSQNITFSWMHFDGVNDNECDGSHTRAADVAGATVTFHHCFFDHVETHSPSVHDSTSHVHLFDNLLSDNASYAVESACGASVLLEANTFQRVATPTERATCPDDTSIGLVDAPAGSNYYGDDVGPNHGGDGQEPHDAVVKPTYAYTLGVPEDEWLTILTLRAGAGEQWSQPLSLD